MPLIILVGGYRSGRDVGPGVSESGYILEIPKSGVFRRLCRLRTAGVCNMWK